MKKTDICESMILVEDPAWTFQLDDEEDRRFAVLAEITDMADVTGEPEYEDYPYLVSLSVVAANPHESFNESGAKSDRLGLIYDTHSYCGGVPVDHTLTDAIRGGSESSSDAFQAVASRFSCEEAIVRKSKPQFGTVAAQRGKDSEFRYLQFKTDDAARKYIDYLVEHRMPALGMMIGFILDNPINLMGESGWRTMELHVRGKERVS